MQTSKEGAAEPTRSPDTTRRARKRSGRRKKTTSWKECKHEEGLSVRLRDIATKVRQGLYKPDPHRVAERFLVREIFDRDAWQTDRRQR